MNTKLMFFVEFTRPLTPEEREDLRSALVAQCEDYGVSITATKVIVNEHPHANPIACPQCSLHLDHAEHCGWNS